MIAFLVFYHCKLNIFCHQAVGRTKRATVSSPQSHVVNGNTIDAAFDDVYNYKLQTQYNSCIVVYVTLKAA